MGGIIVFSCVISDRLINRLSSSEAQFFFLNAAALLCNKGQLRTTVRMGLYELDKQLIDYQKKYNSANVIYDDVHHTINFTHAKQALMEIAPKNGGIPQEILLEWYSKRGLV